MDFLAGAYGCVRVLWFGKRTGGWGGEERGDKRKSAGGKGDREEV